VCTIQHIPSGLFLEIRDGGEVGLAPKNFFTSIPSETAQWEGYEREDGVSAFRSVVSRRWLGQRFQGDIKVKATKWSSWEGWEIDWDRPSALMSCSANFNAGGWVHTLGEKGERPFRLVALSASLEDKRAAPLWRIESVKSEPGLRH